MRQIGDQFRAWTDDSALLRDLDRYFEEKFRIPGQIPFPPLFSKESVMLKDRIQEWVNAWQAEGKAEGG